MTVAILIAGPTASGKSALAAALAAEVNGEVINADSMQVYRELRVLTARPSDEEAATAPHRLYGHVPAAEAYSAGRFAEEAARELVSVTASGRIPIFVGGTGLYFRVLLEGLSPIPTVPADVRAHWRESALRLDGPALHAELQKRDPEMGRRLSATDPQRIVRALEVLDATGTSLAEWQREPGRPVIQSDRRTLRLVVHRERSQLYGRANQRFLKMLDSGALDEVRSLMAQRLQPELPAMRALGVRPLIGYLEGRISREHAVERTQRETRNYIKRQLTWNRRFMSDWHVVDLTDTSVSSIVASLTRSARLDGGNIGG